MCGYQSRATNSRSEIRLSGCCFLCLIRFFVALNILSCIPTENPSGVSISHLIGNSVILWVGIKVRPPGAKHGAICGASVGAVSCAEAKAARVMATATKDDLIFDAQIICDFPWTSILWS